MALNFRILNWSQKMVSRFQHGIPHRRMARLFWSHMGMEISAPKIFMYYLPVMATVSSPGIFVRTGKAEEISRHWAILKHLTPKPHCISHWPNRALSTLAHGAAPWAP